MKIYGHATYVGTTGYNAHCQSFFRALSKTNEIKIRNFTIGKNWRGMHGDAFPEENPHGSDVDDLDKKLLAKQSLWSNEVLTDYNIYNGLGDFKHDVNLVIGEVDHFYLFHEYQGPKIYYTVWENTLYPQVSIDNFKRYDQIWVPSKWQAEITIKQGIEEDKVKVIPEGVDTSLFYPEDISYDDDKFRFLVFGRWDQRKSTKELISAFKNLFGNNPKVELVISVDNYYSSDGLITTEERLKKYNLECNNIKILHFPNREDYVKYLKKGHVFLSCARSEGWNLPLIEAMSCGIPSIYSDCCGQLEFAEGKGISVKIKGERPVKEYVESFSAAWKNFEVGNWYEPDFKDLEVKMMEVYNNYNFYKKKALDDSKIIREEFTWDKAAEKANKELKNLLNKKQNFQTQNKSFNFESFFSKYRKEIERTGLSRVRFYEYIIPKLVSKNKPLYILETGTMWEPFERNTGAFTLVMADLIKNFTGGKIFTVDISQENINKCKKNTEGLHEAIEFVLSDSIEYIKNSSDDFIKSLDLVYLDSYDFSLLEPHNSAQHHLEELNALYDRINSDCGIGIDDNFLPGCWVDWNWFNPDGSIVRTQRIDVVDSVKGKGQYCDKKLIKEGWKRFFEFDQGSGSNVFYYEKINNKIKKTNLLTAPISLGEIVDKITILKIKQTKISDCALEIEKEIELLQSLIKDYEINTDLINELQKINLDLWEIEDRIRIKEQLNQFDQEFINLARSVYKTNDKRSEVKSSINKLYNSEIVEYKYHTKIKKNNVINIINESDSLGDTIAWTAIVSEFAKKNKDSTINYYTAFKNIFQDKNSSINFFDYAKKPNKSKDNYYSIECVDEKVWKNLNLQDIACSVLGIEYREVKPEIKIPNKNKFKFPKKYVCIATQSSLQSRYWNNLNGWDELISYLHKLGYFVVCVDKYASFGIKEKMNLCPKSVDCFLDSKDIEDTIDVINNCEFFIGLSSGLSWLAWSLNKSVVLISGSVQPFFEFKNEYRVYNDKVCFGCFNDNSYSLDKNNWLWCPRNKDFECSKQISFEMVKEKVNDCIKNLPKK